jgi:hypothetical protein
MRKVFFGDYELENESEKKVHYKKLRSKISLNFDAMK